MTQVREEGFSYSHTFTTFYTECAKLYLENIRGALSLLEFTSQITEENYNRINKLTHIIRKKYKLY